MNEPSQGLRKLCAYLSQRTLRRPSLASTHQYCCHAGSINLYAVAVRTAETRRGIVTYRRFAPRPGCPVRAEDVFKNIETFKGKPATQVLIAMNSIRGTLGVSCTYCHTQYEWDKNDKPAKETTRKMFKMLGYIEGKYFDHKNKVTCWTCHRGHAEQPRPTDKPPEQAEQYIHVAPEDAKKPSEEVFHNIQSLKGVPAGKLPFVMNFFAQSLGVKCSHCHVQDHWEKDDVAAKQNARNMLAMVHDVLHEYYGGNGPISCSGCHQGKVKPENGLEPQAQKTP